MISWWHLLINPPVHTGAGAHWHTKDIGGNQTQRHIHWTGLNHTLMLSMLNWYQADRRPDPKEENAHIPLGTRKTAQRMMFDCQNKTTRHKIKLLPRQAGSAYYSWPVNAHCTRYLLLESMHLPWALSFYYSLIFLSLFTQKYFLKHLL